MPLFAFWPCGTSTTLRALNRAFAMCYLCSGGLGKLYSLVLATRKVIAVVCPAGKACSVSNKPCARHARLQQSDLCRGNVEGCALSTRCLQQARVPDASYLHECGLSPVSLLALQLILRIHPLIASLFSRLELQGQLYHKKNGPSAFPAKD